MDKLKGYSYGMMGGVQNWAFLIETAGRPIYRRSVVALTTAAVL